MSLSDGQFDNLAKDANDPEVGGFTVASRGKNAGESPPDRFLVGQGKEAKTPSGKMTGSDVRSYEASNARSLARKEHFLGGWDHEGTGYLDVSKGFPTTGAGETAARASTLKHGEMAYGESNSKGEYAGDHANPFHGENNKGDITNSGEKDQKKAWVGMPSSQPRTTGKRVDLQNQSFS